MNKNAVLLYNAYSGHQEVVSNLDYITARIQDMGCNLQIFRSQGKGSMEKYIMEKIDSDTTEMIIVSGGDGTINECVQGMIRKKLTHIPLGILPLGTANDFANSLGIPSKLSQALDIIANRYYDLVDIGNVNDNYFVNVCNMGAFSQVSHEVDTELKNKFGKLAYYVKGFDVIQNYQDMDLELITEDKCYSGKFFLVLIFNGKGAGGFMKLAKDASLFDGLFDVVCFKNLAFQDMPLLFLKVLQGEHFDNPNVLYFQTKSLTINSQQNIQYCTDVDGEKGPLLPLNISVIPQAMKIFMPSTSR
ncbi:lipid kinase [Sporanaerobium hydrogeniformans]|uniref:Lipid kinase n=1 Tax=Sporanaerobium hydrogeniformans TaxID=3072179 RepID=A0AC61DCW4_9FIRM|nr:YegS/Rv2252/BmrU family lipid kinase [Sporanaerobium hydrogeniformans]PHV70613.1 lipid kinase [Sporanaerobium hydrogeniformans]